MNRTIRVGFMAAVAVVLSALLYLPLLEVAKVFPDEQWSRGDLMDSLFAGGAIVGDDVVVYRGWDQTGGLDKKTGDTLWTLPGTWSHAATGKDMVFTCYNGESRGSLGIRALSIDNGSLAWTTLEEERPCFDLEVKDGNLYALVGGSLFRMDGRHGKMDWESRGGKFIEMGTNIAVVGSTNSLRGVELEHGRTIWETELSDVHWSNTVLVSWTPSGVAVAYDTYDTNGEDLTWHVRLVDASDGTFVWTWDGSSHGDVRSLATSDKTVFVGTDADIHALSLETGEPDWSALCAPAKDLATVKSRVFAVCKDYGIDSKLVAFEADTGRTDWVVKAHKSGCCRNLVGVDQENVYLTHSPSLFSIGQDGSMPVIVSWPPRGPAIWVGLVGTPLLSIGLVAGAHLHWRWYAKV